MSHPYHQSAHTAQYNESEGIAMTMYAVYSNGNWEAEFETLQEAREYIRNLVKGTAEHYGKSEKYIKSILLLTIEEVQY